MNISADDTLLNPKGRHTRDNCTTQFLECLHADLRHSAPILWREAARLCYRDSAEGLSCAHYHKVWQYLRLLGINTSIESESEFFIDKLRMLMRANAALSVLVCGSADYGMLAHLWWAARLENTTPRLTVIDRCPTAALANRWFADSKEMEVRVIVEDVLKLERAFTERFDLVCNHNFFGQFPPDVRREVIGQCRRVLSPEGWLLTANRLRPGPGSLDTPYTLTRSQAESTLERVRMSLLQSTEPIPDSEEFQAALMAFLQGKRGYRIQSEVDFSNMLAEHGLAIMVSETGIVASPVRDTNPDCPQGSTTTHREILRVLARACDPELKRVNSASCNFGA